MAPRPPEGAARMPYTTRMVGEEDEGDGLDADRGGDGRRASIGRIARWARLRRVSLHSPPSFPPASSYILPLRTTWRTCRAMTGTTQMTFTRYNQTSQ